MAGFFAGSQVTGTRPSTGIAQCGKCGLYKKCKSPKLQVRGQGRKKILIVVEMPSDDEDAAGRWLANKCTSLVTALTRAGADIDKDCWVTGALICKGGGKKAAEQINYCRANVKKTIQELQPTAIILLGSHAVTSVIGWLWKEDPGPITRWAGYTIPCRSLNAWICPTFSPDHLTGNSTSAIRKKEFVKHIRKAVMLSDATPHAEIVDLSKEVQIIKEPRKAAVAIRELAKKKNGYLAFDYESNQLKPDSEDSVIVSCSLCWGRKSPEITIAYPWVGPTIEATKEILRSPLPKIASNAKFEERWTRRHLRCRVRNWNWDTMIAAHAIDNRGSISSIKFQSFVLLGVELWNSHIEKFLRGKRGKRVNQILEEIDLDDLLLYNGLDSYLELAVAFKQKKFLGIKT